MSQQASKIFKAQPWQVELDKTISIAVDPSCIGVAQSLDAEHILDFAVDSSIQHICQKNGHMFDAEVASSYSMIDSPESYLEFPAATIFSPQQLNLQAERSLLSLDFHFDSSKQKQELLQAVSKVLVSRGVAQSISENVHSIADEYFTNAVYNAPFIDIDTHKNPGVSRQGSEIKMQDGKFGRMFIAQDKDRLMVGCQDPFGSLNLGKFLNRVRSSYKKGPAAMLNFGAGGAGIGSYMIFDAGSSLYFGVWPGQATILCCLLPLGMSNRKRVQLAKHLHWIQR